MKKLFTFIAVIALLIAPAIPSNAQDAGIYSKGTWHYNINQNMSIGFYGNKANGEKNGKTINSNISFGAEYFVIDNFAAGLRLNREKDVDKNGTKDIWRWNTIDLSVLYGKSFDNFNLQGRAWIGTGGVRDYMEALDYDDKGNLFNWGIEVESPINISGGCNGYLTPGIGYSYQKLTWDEGPFAKSTGFYFDVDLTFFIPMNDHYCDIRNGCRGEDLRYAKGSAAMGASAPFRFYLGTWKSEQETEPGHIVSYHESSNNFEWCLFGYYYVIDNLGIGAHMEIDHYWWQSKDKDQDNWEKGGGTEFIFMPMAIYNLPLDGCLNNIFANAGFGFGVDSWYYETDYWKDEGKDGVTNFYFGVGYNYFFTDFLAMVPRIGYNHYGYKDKTSPEGDKSSTDGLKTSKGGLLLDVGITYFIWPKRSTRYLD